MGSVSLKIGGVTADWALICRPAVIHLKCGLSARRSSALEPFKSLSHHEQQTTRKSDIHSDRPDLK